MSASKKMLHCLKEKETSMNCSKRRTNILLYAEGLLDKRESLALETHMRECNDCRKFMLYVKESLMSVESEKNTGSNPFMATRVLNEMEKRRQPVRYIKRWVPAFMFLLLFFMAIIGGINLGKIYSDIIRYNNNELQEEMSYIDDIEQEQIENFFMTLNKTGNE